MREGLPFPVVFGGIVGLSILLGMACVRIRHAWMLLAAMLFASSIGLFQEYGDILVNQWITPLVWKRSEVYLICGVLLGVVFLVHQRRTPPTRVALPGIVLCCIGVYAGLIRLLAGDASEGVPTVGLVLLTVTPLLLVASRMVWEPRDGVFVARAVAAGAVAWLVATGVQFLINPDTVMTAHDGRFVGVSGNPQSASIFLAPAAVVCLWLYLNDPARLLRPIYAVIAGAATVCLLWTLSRTGLGLLAIGVAAVLFGRFGRGMIHLPVLAILVLLGISATESLGLSIGFDRFSTAGDTRTGAWRHLLSVFAEQPLFGVGQTEGIGKSENSLLYGMAAYGMGMGVLILTLYVAMGLQIISLIRHRAASSPEHRAATDLVIGFLLMYGAGSMLEGYIIARVNAQVVLFCIFTSLGARLVELARQAETEQAGLAQPGEQAGSFEPNALRFEYS